MSDLLAALARANAKPAMSPYWAGWDCGMNGANTTNCHFRIFSTRQNTAEWERGKRDAENKKKAEVPKHA